MSHFTVLVIGEDPDALLAPYHEFECTGQDDEYVQEIEETNATRSEYERRMVKVLRDSEGKDHRYYDEQFYRGPTLEDIEKSKKSGSLFPPTKVHYIPEGFEEVEVPQKELTSYLEYIMDYYGYEGDPVKEGEQPDYDGEHKFGYVVVDENNEVLSVVRRTNPDARWDWYQIGGRWNGFFKLKEGVNDRPVGNPGVFGNDPDRNFTGYADQATKGEIDVQGMRDEAENAARKGYQRLKYFFGGEIPEIETWKAVREREGLSMDEKRDYYHGQEPFKRLRNAKEVNEKEELGFSEEDLSQIMWTQLDEFQCTEDEYAKEARDKAFSTFAFIYEGEWIEKGEMGWWATVSNEKEEGDWLKEFNDMFDSLPDDTLLTLVDCHIQEMTLNPITNDLTDVEYDVYYRSKRVARNITLYAKCSDRFSIVGAINGEYIDYSGYVPSFFDYYGDGISIEIDTQTMKILRVGPIMVENGKLTGISESDIINVVRGEQ